MPGPTLRAREGERLRIRFLNASEHPHTIHFHGIHPAAMDGMPGIGEATAAARSSPGESFTYEFDAAPFGVHLYHCHVAPLASHIARGLYGAFVVDPSEGRPEADEMVMVMNGFDTNFDLANEVYAVNTIGFHYVNEPIAVGRDELVRIYLVNVLEYDPLNSFHVHGNFFHHFPTGTSLKPSEFTDTVIQGQGQRAILELRFPYDGDYMFHAHVSEFAELGWSGFFRVGDPSSWPPPAPRLLRAALGRRSRPDGGPPGGALGGGLPAWALGLIPLALIAAAIGAFALLGGPGLGERSGPPVEEVDGRTHGAAPGDDRADPAQRRPRPGRRSPRSRSTTPTRLQPDGDREIGHLGATTLKIAYPWIEGEAYEIFVLTSAGGTIDADDPGRRRDARSRPRLLRPDGAARDLRRRHPGQPRDALAAVHAPLGRSWMGR